MMSPATKWTEASGTFWVPGEEAAAQPGHVSLQGSGPVLKLSGGLYFDEDYDDGSGDFFPTMLHGSVSGTPSHVTIMGAKTVGRRHGGNIFGGHDSHDLMGRHCIFGGHVSPGEKFTRVRARFNVLDSWANIFRPHSTYDSKTGDRTLAWTADPALPEPVLTDLGALSLVAPPPLLNVDDRGATLSSEVWLEWSFTEAVSFEAVFTDFVRPVQDYFNVIYAEKCYVEALGLSRGDAWLEVGGQGLDQNEKPPIGEPLLPIRLTGLRSIAAWIDLSKKLDPIPQFIGQVFGTRSNLEDSRVFEFCAAAEGLHQKLHSDRQAGPCGKRRRPAYKDRLRSLLADVEDILPGVCGDAAPWLTLATQTRNSNAHSLVSEGDDGEQRMRSVVAQPLKWILAARILLEAGNPPETLAKAIQRSGKITWLIYRGRLFAPEIYGPPSRIEDVEDEFVAQCSG